MHHLFLHFFSCPEEYSPYSYFLYVDLDKFQSPLQKHWSYENFQELPTYSVHDILHPYSLGDFPRPKMNVFSSTNSLLHILYNRYCVPLFLRVVCRWLWWVELYWVWWSVHFVWLGSYGLSVSPLFWDNVCRRFWLKGEASLSNFLRGFPWARLNSLGICTLRASNWFLGRWR